MTFESKFRKLEMKKENEIEILYRRGRIYIKDKKNVSDDKGVNEELTTEE